MSKTVPTFGPETVPTFGPAGAVFGDIFGPFSDRKCDAGAVTAILRVSPAEGRALGRGAGKPGAAKRWLREDSASPPQPAPAPTEHRNPTQGTEKPAPTPDPQCNLQ